MNDAAPPRRIWLCADDYGLSPGVNRAIRDLIGRGRLNATSVMMVGPAIGRDEVSALQAVAANRSRMRDRPACHFNGAVSSADHALPADRWRHVPGPSEIAARGPAAAARSRNHLCGIDRATCRLQRNVRPRSGFRRRPPACPAVSPGPRRLSDGGERSRAQGLGPPGWTPSAFGPAARYAQGVVAGRSKRAISQARLPRRYCIQSRIRRRL